MKIYTKVSWERYVDTGNKRLLKEVYPPAMVAGRVYVLAGEGWEVEIQANKAFIQIT